MDSRRASGILLHISSLPSAYGIGDLGPSAYRFADYLTQTRQSLWQVLPVGPVGPNASPYSSSSTFAGNPLLISPAPLVESGLLAEEDLSPLVELPDSYVDYGRLVPRKREVLRTAFRRFETDSAPVDTTELERFRRSEAHWLEDYALYAALKEAHGGTWTDWPSPLVHRDPNALQNAREEHADAVRKHIFWQYLFDRQWSALQAYCHARDIRLFGDLPIYVAHDSADVWAHQDLFHLNEQGEPPVVAGVPPDYFSPEGQRWGNPIYRWDRMQQNGFQWWAQRLGHILDRFDLVRLDHFRGFEAYWQVPAHEETAVNGEWAEGPSTSFFDVMEEKLGELPLVAEDLGTISEAVHELRDAYDLPGMSVLQFAFDDGPENPFLPHNYEPNTVAYTGTHDNNTTLGWWNHELSTAGKKYAHSYLNLDSNESEVLSQCIRALQASVADRVIVPLQDVLGLGAEARMNVPGEPSGNWRWRFTSDQLEETGDLLASLTRIYGRAESSE